MSHSLSRGACAPAIPLNRRRAALAVVALGASMIAAPAFAQA